MPPGVQCPGRHGTSSSARRAVADEVVAADRVPGAAGPQRTHLAGGRLTVEQKRPPPLAAEPEAVDQRTIRLVFATVALGMLLAALDQTIVSTALPSIVNDLG